MDEDLKLRLAKFAAEFLKNKNLLTLDNETHLLLINEGLLHFKYDHDHTRLYLDKRLKEFYESNT